VAAGGAAMKKVEGRWLMVKGRGKENIECRILNFE
jgi:hypothetical protein